MTASTAPRPGGPRLLVASEIALILVHLAVAVGFTRLYEGQSFLSSLVVYPLAAHALAIACRRAHLPVLLVAAAAVAGAALVTGWVAFADTLTWGLPTGDTWSALTEAVAEAREQFRVVVAPAPALPGFQVLAGLALWAAAWFSDWAALRLRTTIEAVSPALVLFFFASLLGSGDHRLVSALLFAGAVLVFVATHRAYRAGVERTWVNPPDRTGRGPVSLLTRSSALALVALLIGAAAAPRLPGHDDAAVFTWRAQKRSPESRTVGDPFVDIRSRLVDQGDVELFRVGANRPAYWRLTSLGDFDGTRWTSSGLYSSAGGDLDRPPVSGPSRQIFQRFEVSGLRSEWVPAAFLAARVTSGQQMRWNPDSGSLLTGEDEPGLVPGFIYEVESRTPLLNPDRMRGALQRRTVPAGYLDLPSGLDPRVRAEAALATTGATNDFDQALALQNWFRHNFEYSLEPELDPGDPILSFLTNRIGYCEQFAGTYAAMARLLGLPARVAVGFTQGDLDPETGEYVVRGRHAHAWPEVYLGDVGWVAFEPTPNRGIPDAEEYTGVPPQQEAPDPGPDLTGPSTSAPAPVTPSTTTPAAPSAAPAAPAAPADSTDGDSQPRGWTRLAALVLVAGAGWVTLALAGPWIRRRRIRRVTHPGRRVLLAWDEALTPVRWITGHRHQPSETYVEFAHRSGPSLGSRAPSIVQLAGLATQASWDPEGIGAAEADTALSTAQRLRSDATRDETMRRRILRALSWQEVRTQWSSGSLPDSRRRVRSRSPLASK